ncbi:MULTISPECIES: metallopeptidase family protein [unclassified Bartonella]|uniref:metallopeptidase family protein n=1 Tax=unclassified Bartonella TaxID=2645622 RepID=UPI0015FDF3F5|nr:MULTISPECIES: metallopeptidase family protein [unclassified Bartonella]UXN03937.1 metallopeptidase family protein [Bartonella sp. HY406]UXN06918.1 metallopeptidase family protein [Bartonella sp. HY761]
MARMDQSRDWKAKLAPSLGELDSLTVEAYAQLPEKFRALCGDLIISVTDFPEDQIIEDMGLDSPFELLGLFEGNGIGERFSFPTGEKQNRMTIFRRAILDYWSENPETLGDILTQILIYEIGNHFGLSDKDMEQVEEAAETCL